MDILRPLTPQEYRDRLVASYMNSFRLWGLDVSQTQVERMVIADCELVANAGVAPQSSSPKAVKTDYIRPDLIAEAEAKTHTKLTTVSEHEAGKHLPRKYRPRALHQRAHTVSERWGAACARIFRIMQGAGGASSLIAATATAEVPKLAKQYMELWAYYMTRTKVPPLTGIDHNPFRYLSDRDASRMFMRLVEDICDRSVKYLNSWYTK